MIEITDRWGLAKVGTWFLEDDKIETPNVFMIEGGKNDTPNDEKNISISSGDKGTLRTFESFFCERGEDDERSIPRTFGYPGSIGGKLVESRGEGGKIQVLYDQEPDPNAELYVIANSPELTGRSRRLVKKISSLREKISYHKLIYTPGIGLPKNVALLVYLGVDLFDSIYCDYLENRDVKVSDFMGFAGDGKENRKILLKEIDNVRRAVKNKKIRELVESRCRSEPWMVEALRLADERYDIFVDSIPMTGDKIYVTTREGLKRPDVERFRRRLRDRYSPPKRDVLLLLPCSAHKPYFQSYSHRQFRKKIKMCDWTRVHEVVITSPLGVVPREIELFYPAQQYDIPVTHEWYQDEKRLITDELRNLIGEYDYPTVISHLPDDMDFIVEEIGCTDSAIGGHPTDEESLKRLGDILIENTGEELGDVQRFLWENILSFARFQFGDAGDALLKDAVIKGRYPNYKIFADGVQRGMIVSERGLISLTLRGAKIIKEEDVYQVEIDDFMPKGTVFAVGVEDAHEMISPGDECIVIHDGELRGVGPALMSGGEMTEAERGGAVKIRHHG